MKRGEVRVLRSDGYAGKARPAVIVQSDKLDTFGSVVLCLFTTFESTHVPTRVSIVADKTNGLTKNSFVMTEKLVTVPRDEVGKKVGILTSGDMQLISQKLRAVLGISD
jgi:mRNA interferase MazF